MNKTTPKTRHQTVRSARDELDTLIRALPPLDHTRTKLEAFRAIVNADEIDRRTGLTRENEDTPGYLIASEVLVGA